MYFRSLPLLSAALASNFTVSPTPFNSFLLAVGVYVFVVIEASFFVPYQSSCFVLGKRYRCIAIAGGSQQHCDPVADLWNRDLRGVIVFPR